MDIFSATEYTGGSGASTLPKLTYAQGLLTVDLTKMVGYGLQECQPRMRLAFLRSPVYFGVLPSVAFFS
ncbi:hypothetical protein SQ11_14065 [Nitrosospira sp. NpAV]|nr:hypothetical protein SQ11_14065 [Nitrosospira sp. NpAV]